MLPFLRSMHAASTMQARGAALVCGGGGALSLFALPFLASPLASEPLILALWGGGVSRVAPFGTFRALRPRLW